MKLVKSDGRDWKGIVAMTVAHLFMWYLFVFSAHEAGKLLDGPCEPYALLLMLVDLAGMAIGAHMAAVSREILIMLWSPVDA